MKPSLTVGLVPRIATRLLATHNLPEHQKWKASVLPCQSKKPPALNMRGRLLKCSRSLTQPFSSFLRGAIRFKSPRFSFQNSKNSLCDGTLRLSSPPSMIGAVLNTLNRTQCFLYRSPVITRVCQKPARKQGQHSRRRLSHYPTVRRQLS